MGIYVAAQIRVFKRAHRVFEADDRPAVAGTFKGLGLHHPEEFSARIVLSALDFLHNNFHFGFHVFRLKGG